MTAVPPELLKVHRRNNRNSAEGWAPFAEHRARMTALAAGAAGDAPDSTLAGTIAILGAGNCNDLDLETLAARFAEIHLVDIDDEALRRAVDRQPAEVAGKLRTHAPIDVSGALPQLSAFRKTPPTTAALEQLTKTAVENVGRALPRTFDTAMSACLLSQLMHSCRVALSLERPDLPAIATAVATAHLRSLVSLVRPGGTGLFVTDVVSSETYPLEELWGERPPLELLKHLEETENVFSNASPTFVRRLLARDPVIAPLIEPPQLIEPWLWRLGDKVTLLVYALVLRRR